MVRRETTKCSVDVVMVFFFFPLFLQLASNGVRANFLLPQFPTKTFPNHYSMATVSNQGNGTTCLTASLAFEIALQRRAYF